MCCKCAVACAAPCPTGTCQAHLCNSCVPRSGTIAHLLRCHDHVWRSLCRFPHKINFSYFRVLAHLRFMCLGTPSSSPRAVSHCCTALLGANLPRHVCVPAHQKGCASSCCQPSQALVKTMHVGKNSTDMCTFVSKLVDGTRMFAGQGPMLCACCESPQLCSMTCVNTWMVLLQQIMPIREAVVVQAG